MAFKFIVALAFVAVATAGLVPVHQQYHAAQPVLVKSEDSHDPHPQYQFSYSVNDAHTGDSKHQTETRDGDVVQGEYSLIDSDGYKRTVHYTADSIHGFNAVVNREPLGHVVKAVHAAPVAYAAPATVIKSAPVAYAAAPTLVKSAHLGYAAPNAYTQTYAAAPAYHGYAQNYAAAPALVKSAHLGYAQTYAAGPAYHGYAQNYAAAPVAYSHAPATYTSQTLVKSSPVSYAAPAYAYHH